MSASTQKSQPVFRPPATDRAHVFLAAAVLAVALFVAYSNTFRVPMLFDDQTSVVSNASIRNLTDLRSVLSPETLSTARRPVLNLSFAVNYAVGALDVRGYHEANLLIHGIASLLLFGVARRSLLLQSSSDRFRSHATWIAATIAALWGLHPVQTASVTYISQRSESLAGLFYLLIIYSFIRSVNSSRAALWLQVSWVACFLGMSTKELVVTAPILVILYDGAFVSGSAKEALLKRPVYYAAMAACWLWMGFLMAHFGFQDSGVVLTPDASWWDYACTEAKVIVRYVGLAFWPRPLVFDYGPELLVHGIASVWPFVVLVLGALLGTVLAWRWSKAGGFLAASFFVLLAPTSSFVPILTQPMAENRLYLPLAAVIAMLVLAAARLLGVRAMVGFAAVTVVFAALSFARNRTYATEIGLWEDSLKVEPLNFRGHTALGDALAKTGGRRAEAVVQYREVIRLNPDDAVAHCNLGTTLALMPGGRSEAIEQFRETLRLRPNNSLARRNLATVLAKSRETLSEAAEQFEAVLKANPDDAVTHYDLANVFTRIPGKMPNAISEYKAALKTNPDFLEAHTGLSYVYFRIPGMMPEAIEQLKILVRLRPNDITSKYRLGLAYYFLGDLQKAIDEWNAVLRQNPNFEQARNSLAYVDKQRKGILVDGAIPQ